MTVKSIRKDDVNVTAKQLGVKVGDRFVVLPQRERYNLQKNVGGSHFVDDILVLLNDDGSPNPLFINQRTGSQYYESFACLARYEEKEKDISLRNVKFDMEAIAEELGVSLEKAHYIVQTALFERGAKWAVNVTRVSHQDVEFLFVWEDGEITWNTRDSQPTYKQLFIKSQYSFYVKEEKPETIEFNGKQYNKEDVAKALSLLSPIK